MAPGVKPDAVIGVDPGLACSGIVVLDYSTLSPLRMVAIREGRTMKDAPIWERAHLVASRVFAEVCDVKGLLVVGVEGPAPRAQIMVKGKPMVQTKTIEQLARVRQALSHALRPNVYDDLNVTFVGPQIRRYYEPTPNQVKKAATGKGNAKKDHVQASIRGMLRGAQPEAMDDFSDLPGYQQEAIADAFGVALATAALHVSSSHARRTTLP